MSHKAANDGHGQKLLLRSILLLTEKKLDLLRCFLTAAHFSPLSDVVGPTTLFADILWCTARSGCCSADAPAPVDLPLTFVLSQYGGLSAGTSIWAPERICWLLPLKL